MSSSVASLIPGEYFTTQVDPLAIWRGSLRVDKPIALYRMNVTVRGPGGANNVAVYGKRGSPPSITDYDWAHIVNADGDTKRLDAVSKRASESGGRFTMEQRLGRGNWFIAILNDDASNGRSLRGVILESKTAQSSSSSTPFSRQCPGGCRGRGKCIDGQCRCQSPFAGEDCSLSK